MFDRMIMDYNTGAEELMSTRVNREFFHAMDGLRGIMGGSSNITPRLLGRVLGSTYGISRDPSGFWHVYSGYLQAAGARSGDALTEATLEKYRRRFVKSFVAYLQY